MRFFLTIFVFFSFLNLSAQELLEVHALRIDQTIQIDGVLDEDVWQKAQIATNFRQYDPYFDRDPTQKTEVRVLYDDNALYIGAVMYDSAPDSILMQLGNRNDAVNADAFGLRIDTYNKQHDAYTFEVSASGVQVDYRERDRSFNAVWESAVSINDNGWSVEIRIPYAAIRFPAQNKQKWRVQFYRNFRRIREWSQWALEERTDDNKMAYWGLLQGVENIKPPLRLSFTPYFTAFAEHYPYDISTQSNISSSVSGGLDLKWGINESFTLDMTLLPDFSQVQSDNVVKNLTAFETTYDENRPFFQESVDLFTKEDLFYTRRIGRTPLHYYAVEAQMDTLETVISNPYQAKLLNATKLSGRHSNGLAFGLFNALTDNTYAEVESADKESVKVLTDPMTNYNISVIDKAFKNNSSVFLINTNVLRQGENYRNANVTAAGVSLLTNNNRYRLNLSGAHSRIYKDNSKMLSGNRYRFFIGKVRGNLTYNFSRNLTDNTFDKNDMGLMHRNNQVNNAAAVHYNFLEPFSFFLNFRSGLTFENDYHYISKKITNRKLRFNFSTTLQNHLSLWGNVYKNFYKIHDFYEARTAERYFLQPLHKGGFFAFSSDYRRMLAIDGRIEIVLRPETAGRYSAYRLTPIVRANDNFSFNYTVFYAQHNNDIGYAGKSNSDIFFGRRDVNTVENSFSGTYIIQNDLSLNLRLRHYWVTGIYDSYFLLKHDGVLEPTDMYDSEKDFNFNSFNIDLMFNWQFAPGSYLSIIWKNAILDERSDILLNYFENISELGKSPQLNTLTIKLMYYIDYQKLKKHI